MALRMERKFAIVRYLMKRLGLLSLVCGVLVAQDDPFAEEFKYFQSTQHGERLVVSYPDSESDRVRAMELTLFEESYYNVESRGYRQRLVGIITGMGLGSTGLKIVITDRNQIFRISRVLDEFKRVHETFLESRERIEEETEDWMGASWEAFSDGRPIGSVYFYPSQKELEAEFNWDFELDRVWLSIGQRIFLDHDMVPFLHHYLNHIEDYADQFYDYRAQLNEKNEQIDRILGISQY